MCFPPGCHTKARQLELRAALSQALISDDVGPLQAALRHGALLDGPVAEDGSTALHIAVGPDAGSCIGAPCGFGPGPNRSAATRGSQEHRRHVVEWLLEMGAHPERKDNWGQNPLLAAAGLGDTRILWLLLRAHARPDTRDGEGRSAMRRALESQNCDAFLFLARVAPQEHLVQEMPICLASVRRLLPYLGHREDMVFALLGSCCASAVCLEERQQTLLQAVCVEYFTVVQTLIDIEGVSPNTCSMDGTTCLILAASLGLWRMAQYLLQLRADVHPCDAKGRTALHVAAEAAAFCGEAGHLRTLKVLINWRAPKEARDHFGATALATAVAQGHAEAVRCLLDAGAVPSGPLPSGPGLNLPVPLRGAVDQGRRFSRVHVDGVGHGPRLEPLPLGGAEYAAAANLFRAAAHLRPGRLKIACMRASTPTAGAFGVDVVDDEGRTPLMVACCASTQADAIEAVELLLSMSSHCVWLADVNGETAVMKAARWGWVRVLSILLGATQLDERLLARTVDIFAEPAPPRLSLPAGRQVDGPDGSDGSGGPPTVNDRQVLARLEAGVKVRVVVSSEASAWCRKVQWDSGGGEVASGWMQYQVSRGQNL